MITDRERAALQQRQQQLIQCVFDQDSPCTTGLRVYRHSLWSNGARALSITYPVLTRLLGNDAMAVLARTLLRQSPPAGGDWAEWGEDLIPLVDSAPELAQMDFLRDVARLEWAWHQVSRSAPVALDPSSLTRLQECAPEDIRLQLSPAIVLLRSPFPIDAIWRAHRPPSAQHNLDNHSLDLGALSRAIAEQDGDCFLLIDQRRGRAHLQRLSGDEFQWFDDLLRGLDLAELLERHPDFNFVHWFSRAVQLQWITHLR